MVERSVEARRVLGSIPRRDIGNNKFIGQLASYRIVNYKFGGVTEPSRLSGYSPERTLGKVTLEGVKGIEWLRLSKPLAHIISRLG